MRYFKARSGQIALETACILSDLLDDIEQALGTDRELSDDNIHTIRKRCKRLRALLRLVQTALDRTEFRKADRAIRNYAALLAHTRDSTVLVATVDRLAEHFGALLTADALAPIRETLSDNSTRQGNPIPASSELIKGLNRIRRNLSGLDYSGITVDTLLQGLLISYRRGRKALALLEETPDDDPSHELRRYTKYLYNQLLMLREWNPEGLAATVGHYHTTEDTLGLVHDLSLLIETVRTNRALDNAALHRELLLSLAESRWLSLLSDGMRMARKLYRRKPGKQQAWLAQQLGLAAD